MPALSFPILAAAGPAVEDILLKVLLQLCIMLAAARLFAVAFRKIGQPAVIGETAAGLALGPSLFGHFFPDAFKTVFDPAVKDVFLMLSQLGLIFLLFLVGLEFDFSHLKKHGRSSLLISLSGIALPFGLGWLLAHFLHATLKLDVPVLGFSLFMGTAMSITAIPVLARIMLELNIARSQLGAIVITAAAVDDAMGWTLLASVSALVKAEFSPVLTAKMILETLAFAAFILFVLKPPLVRMLRKAIARDNGKLSVNWLAAILVLLFLCAIATNLIGIFAIFGAFLLGAALSSEHKFREAFQERSRDLVTALLLPIFFTYTGLRTNIGSLDSSALWFSALAIVIAAVAGKYGGCMFAARFGGFSWREASCIGALMNTRGLMELIVINAGRDLGVIPDSVFCMLVLMAIATTAMTCPILLRLQNGTELEPYIADSIFAKHAG